MAQKTTEGSSEVRPAHRFDLEMLSRHLEQGIQDRGLFQPPLVGVRQFSNGQSNPTFLLKDSRGTDFVMRKKPPGKLLSSAHAVDREFRILKALGSQGFPVPKALHYCEDSNVIGTPFYVMEFVNGRIFRDPSLPGVEPEERAAIYDSMNRVLAQMHMVDWKALGLSDYGRPGNYNKRQIARWKAQYEASKTSPIPAIEFVVDWLEKNIPEETCASDPDAKELTSIVHGDYRLDNMIFHPTEPRVIAVLDWELSTLGNPLADLAYNCLPYYQSWNGLAEKAQSELRGIPKELDYVRAYLQRTKRDKIVGWNFYLSLASFRLASIAQGVYARSLQGNASSETASNYGVAAQVMAELAQSFITQAPHTISLSRTPHSRL